MKYKNSENIPNNLIYKSVSLKKIKILKERDSIVPSRFIISSNH